jgi:hypothetical protein
MVIERMSDDHRLLLITLVTQTWVRIRDDKFMATTTQECEDILRMLRGSDTRICVERSSASTESK